MPCTASASTSNARYLIFSPFLQLDGKERNVCCCFLPLPIRFRLSDNFRLKSLNNITILIETLKIWCIFRKRHITTNFLLAFFVSFFNKSLVTGAFFARCYSRYFGALPLYFMNDIYPSFIDRPATQ